MTVDGVHPAAQDPTRLLDQCLVRRGRRSGPGGQHRNKVETAVVLVHEGTGVRAEATERRSQHENLRVALWRLRVNLALSVRTDFSRGSTPSTLWQSRCRSGRLAIRATHDDFPAVLAEALDVVRASEFDVRDASSQLGITSSQLTRLLRVEPRALECVNREREARGLRRLR